MTRRMHPHGTRSAYIHYKCKCVACTRANREEQARLGVDRKRRLADVPADDPRHGTCSFYVNWGCRCQACKTANSVKCAADKAARVARGLPDGAEQHGTLNGYSSYGCRCDLCKAAMRAYERNRKK